MRLGTYSLGELIKVLEMQYPDHVPPYGLCSPHSHRGNYSELAFELRPGLSVAEMLSNARFALGTTFTGWKGGEYTMNEWTPVAIANDGEIGESLGRVALAQILGIPLEELTGA
jgi:hypothetical protein